jgi:hypothetical protein
MAQVADLFILPLRLDVQAGMPLGTPLFNVLWGDKLWILISRVSGRL